MPIGTVKIGNLTVSRLILGGNPFSGFSHQTPELDLAMKKYFTADRIKKTFRSAEELGITTCISRADRHITRLLFEYRNEGGKIQWIAQTCPEMKNTARSVEDALSEGAHACFIHGGIMDYLFSHNELDDIPGIIKMIKEAGIPAGIAGHDPQVFEWAEKNLEVDFYMCSYYNSAHRDQEAELKSGRTEWFNNADRDIMVSLIRKLSKPVIHYKIFAAGRTAPRQAFEFTARHLRAGDAACIGVYPENKPEMLIEDAALFNEYVR
ncbi:MAG: hypothetical protein WCU00_12660 [Candidatus Latescibacterota bacterium]